MHNRPSLDGFNPSALSSFQSERQASLLRRSRDLSQLQAGSAPAAPRRPGLRARLLVSVAAVLLLALAFAEIVAAVQ